MPDITIVEVGARDGLQNEGVTLTVDDRVELVRRLAASGLTHIEVGSFVSPKWVPQMIGSDLVLERLQSDTSLSHVQFPVLTPNMKGYERARANGAREISIFGAASESFSQKNINCSIAESLQRFEDVSSQALADDVKVRGYLSCLVACPYEGNIKPSQVVPVVEKLIDLGCYEVSLGDTIGRGTPKSIRNVITALQTEFSDQAFALHCHDTYGMAIANIMAALDLGVTVFDSSVGGAGGCPYAVGASGNVATEDLVYLLEQEGLKTGVDINSLIETSQWLFSKLGRKSASKVNQALSGK